MNRRTLLASYLSLPFLTSRVQAAPDPLPRFRILPDGWGDATIADMEAVANSAMKILWPYFPKRTLEPFVITHVDTVPMVHFERSARKEIIMDLATEGRQWSQFAYQFSHEFCHILCNFDQDGRSNLWFEETVCEAASLFTLRHMATAWKKDPPYDNWRSYASSLSDYAQTVLKGRVKLELPELKTYYQKNASALRTNPTERARNGAMAAVLLNLFEQEPMHWEAVTWLNSTPSPVEETFTAYLQKWLHAAPARHQAFIVRVREAFGLTA